jgi:hypothetical protein
MYNLFFISTLDSLFGPWQWLNHSTSCGETIDVYHLTGIIGPHDAGQAATSTGPVAGQQQSARAKDHPAAK